MKLDLPTWDMLYEVASPTCHLTWVYSSVLILPRETGEIFLVECPVIGGISRRTKEVLLKIIQERVHPGTIIFTDGWAAYRDLPLLGDSSVYILFVCSKSSTTLH